MAEKWVDTAEMVKWLCVKRLVDIADELERLYRLHWSECWQISEYEKENKALKAANADQADKLRRAQARIRELEGA